MGPDPEDRPVLEDHVSDDGPQMSMGPHPMTSAHQARTARLAAVRRGPKGNGFP
jgi:hypothetical protein